jgi:hypothetical protein
MYHKIIKCYYYNKLLANEDVNEGMDSSQVMCLISLLYLHKTIHSDTEGNTRCKGLNTTYANVTRNKPGQTQPNLDTRQLSKSIMLHYIRHFYTRLHRRREKGVVNAKLTLRIT